MNSPLISPQGHIQRNLEGTFVIKQSVLNKPKYDKETKRIMREIRCLKCRKWLCDEYIFTGILKLKCRNCGSVWSIEFKAAKGAV